MRARFKIATAIAAAVILLALPSYLRAYNLSGGSDAPTLLYGDTAIVNHAAFWISAPYTNLRLIHIGKPHRGDLILVQRPDNPASAFKRLMALPGETFELRDNRAYIDGRPLPLAVLNSDFSWVTTRHKMGSTVFDEAGHWIAYTPGKSPLRNFGPIHLGRDEYFLMGDNRDNSLDCREWGPLHERALLGKVVLTLHTGPRSVAAK